MSNSRPPNSDKSDSIGSTIGFRFHANDEELEEVQLKQDNLVDKNSKEKTDNLTFGSLEVAKAVVDSNVTAVDSVRDQWSLLGKRSISVDSAYESPFSNPIETWKKLNVLKEKITKTVEEKIHEMKSERNAPSHSKVVKHFSKENLSISDSEDTSESSKISEQWIDSENQISTCEQTSDDNSETHVTTLNAPLQENQKENGTTEEKSELRNRKGFSSLSKLVTLPEIKIASAKNSVEESPVDSSFGEDVESGVEADENLDGTEENSINLHEIETERGSGEGSQNPPGGTNTFDTVIGIFNSSSILNTNVVGFLLGFTVYLFFPLSEFFRGFLLSLLLVIVWGVIKRYIFFDETSSLQKSFVTPNYKLTPPLKVPESPPAKGVWFNEYEKEVYDPDYYSVTQTVPAYLELENRTLKISRPKGKIHRRATFDEPEYNLPIISQRVYNISNCNIYLMPDGLTRKRLFSKKYPIVIYLKPDSLISEKKNGKEVEDKESEDGNQNTEETSATSESSKSKSVLYLFARCDRQKEEWYRKLLSASRLPNTPVRDQKNEKISEPVEDADDKTEKSSSLNENSSKEASTPFENLFFDDEVSQLEEYFHYMEKFVDVANSNENSNYVKKGKEKENEQTSGLGQVLWFSAFVNRILFDIFRSPYWLEKIQNKVQKKLNSIRLPYYIEDIEVIEMDLGKNGPMFHRVSRPHLNELGLWFDMDVTFDGLIKLTIQTHLNLIKLQQGIEESEGAETQIPDKPKKKEGKKKERLEKESQDSLLLNESIERIKKSTDQFTEILSKASVSSYCTEAVQDCSSQKLRNNPNSLESIANDCAGKLLEELKNLSQAAVNNNNLNENKKRSPIYDSELEDSAESSDEEEESQPSFQPIESEKPHPFSPPKRYPKSRRSSKKIFQVFENVARSKYFRTVAQSKYVQKAIAGVSAARLRLTLEIKSCTGTLSVNIPPPPSDRFWYGFREMPTLVFSVNPKIGDKAVRFVHIKNYLHKKILHELKKIMVTPNMIDFVLPTSAPARSSSFLNIEEPDLQETAISE